MHYLNPFIKNSRGDPEPRRFCERIKNPFWALFDPLNLRWKFSHITYTGALKAKITQNFGREFSKKWAKNALFASYYQKCSRGRSGPQPVGGVPPFRTLPKAALRADFVTPTRALDPLDPPLLDVTRLAFTWSDLNHVNAYMYSITKKVFTWFSECTLTVANATHEWISWPWLSL